MFSLEKLKTDKSIKLKGQFTTLYTLSLEIECSTDTNFLASLNEFNLNLQMHIYKYDVDKCSYQIISNNLVSYNWNNITFSTFRFSQNSQYLYYYKVERDQEYLFIYYTQTNEIKKYLLNQHLDLEYLMYRNFNEGSFNEFILKSQNAIEQVKQLSQFKNNLINNSFQIIPQKMKQFQTITLVDEKRLNIYYQKSTKLVPIMLSKFEFSFFCNSIHLLSNQEIFYDIILPFQIRQNSMKGTFLYLIPQNKLIRKVNCLNHLSKYVFIKEKDYHYMIQYDDGRYNQQISMINFSIKQVPNINQVFIKSLFYKPHAFQNFIPLTFRRQAKLEEYEDTIYIKNQIEDSLIKDEKQEEDVVYTESYATHRQEFIIFN